MGLVGSALAGLILLAEVVGGGFSDFTEGCYREGLKVLVPFSAWEDIGEAYTDKNLEINWRSFSRDGQTHHLDRVGREKRIVVNFEFWHWRWAKRGARNCRLCNLHKTSGWGVSNILEMDVYDAARVDLDVINNDPRPLSIFGQLVLSEHGFSSRSGVGYSLAGGFQSLPNQIDTYASYEDGDARGDEHPHGPKRHVLLSLQILVGGLLAGIGFNLIGYTKREGRNLSVFAGLCCFLGGLAAIIGGVALITGVPLMYLGVLV